VKHKDPTVRKSKARAASRRHGFAAAAAALWLAVASALAPAAALAQVREGSLIRDAEIEATLRAYATPIYEVAGLNPDAIDVYLVAKDDLNAFVAGGMNMFLFTGLLRETDDPLQLMGVIAHEAGHISGGHLAGRRGELENASIGMLASLVVGLGAAIATGSGGAGVAVAGAGQALALGDLLSYTRTQEGSADQAAIKYLTRAGYSPQGLLEFMRTMEDQEVLLTANQEPYLRTHPLTRERIRTLEQAVTEHADLPTEAPDEMRRMHARMHAKLDGFLGNPQQVLDSYPADSDAVPDRYARAIAYYRVPDLTRALELVNGLIEEHPDDPYFRELKGQMLFENGRIGDALPAYRAAVERSPESALLRLALAETQIQLNRPELDEKARANLRRVLDEEPRNAFAWRLLGVAEGRLGNTGAASIALAEHALNSGDLSQALGQARRAQKLFPEHSPSWLHAQDIEREAQRRRDQRN
jgi:predicted Zn-dependent protease